MTQAQVENRTHAVALMAVLHEGEGAHELLPFMADGEREVCEKRVAHLLGSTNGNRDEQLRSELRAMAASESFSGIAEVHPAWILEALKDETPRIMGIIMRYLPSKQVRYVIEHLPPEVSSKIPTLVEAFAVPKTILDVIRRRFESRFLPIHISKTQEHFEFRHLYYLKGEELERLFAELGLYEMAMALDGLPEKMLSVVLNRLDLSDAKRLHRMMQELRGVSREIKQQARYAILESDDECAASGQLLMEIGLNSFARAMNHGDEELFALLRQKLSPRMAYTLKRLIDEQAHAVTPALVEERKNLVLTCIAGLAAESKIDAQWIRFSTDHA